MDFWERRWKANAYFNTLGIAVQPATITTSTNIYCFLILHVMVALSTEIATNPMKTLLSLVFAIFSPFLLSRSHSIRFMLLLCRSIFLLSCAFLMSHSYLHSLMLLHSYSKLSAFIIHLYRNSCSHSTVYLFSRFFLLLSTRLTLPEMNRQMRWASQHTHTLHKMCTSRKWNNSKAQHNLAWHRWVLVSGIIVRLRNSFPKDIAGWYTINMQKAFDHTRNFY